MNKKKYTSLIVDWLHAGHINVLKKVSRNMSAFLELSRDYSNSAK